ncbi:hypothetical protein OAJ94_05615 [Deltaproteobacteria bacterium]|nr:hypothetical protein [Deltaproteobacteria bacterium]
MQCTSCVSEIPDDSIFCTECGSRQDLSKASLPGQVGLAGGEVSGGRGFGVISGEAIRQEREQQQMEQGQLPSGIMAQINQQNMPPQQFPQQEINPMLDQMQQAQQPAIQDPNAQPMSSLLDQMAAGIPSLDQPHLDAAAIEAASLQGMPQPGIDTSIQTPQSLQSTYNPSVSPTDEMVNRLSIAEKEIKNERRGQWLQMNQDSASSVLAQISGELPAHLQEEASKAAEFLKETIGGGENEASIDKSLLRRMAEVSVRRVARKRGVAVETPQSKTESDLLIINVTYVDDGRVLDTPEDLARAFQHAISTELALKGIDLSAEINLFRSKDGEVELVYGKASNPEPEEEEEMFACEMCGGLVVESDSKCNHCGAVFEDEVDDSSSGPPGPGSRGSGPPGPGSRGSGPPGPGSRGSGPSGPAKGGPPGRGGGGPSRGGPPGGPKQGGPPGRGGGGPSRGGPPGGPKQGGPPGRGGGGPPSGPKKGGPPRKGPPQ